MGIGPDHFRPDISGFVVEGASIPGQTAGVVNIWEFTAGASESEDAQKFIIHALRNGDVVCIHFPGLTTTRMILPSSMTPEQVVSFQADYDLYSANLK